MFSMIYAVARGDGLRKSISFPGRYILKINKQKVEYVNSSVTIKIEF